MTSTRVVTIELKCEKCHGRVDVDCAHTAGFRVMNFYALDCPHCRERIHELLPSYIVEVRRGYPDKPHLPEIAAAIAQHA